MSKSTDYGEYQLKPLLFESILFKSNKVPKPRSGHRIVTTESDVYSFGGYNPNISDSDPDPEWDQTKPLFKELWKFSLSTKKWKKLHTSGDPPKELASHSAKLIGNYLFVYGGTGIPFGETSSNKLFVCDLKSLVWKQVLVEGDEDQQPTEQYGQALTVDYQNNCLYVVGGTTGYDYTIDIHKLDLRNRIWQTLYKGTEGHTTPLPRYRHEIALYRDHIYVIGGGTSFTCYSIKQIPVFHIKTKSWSELQTIGDLKNGYPKKRKFHDCVQLQNEVYLVGGTDGSVIFDDFWKLDLNNMQWTHFEAVIPRSVYFHSASVSPLGQMTIFGGVTHINHKERTNELYSVWLKIAPLKEIAWNAVLYYVEKSKTKSLKRALEMRVPNNYYQRLL